MVTEIELFESPDLTPVDICLSGVDEQQSLEKKVRYMRQIACWHFGCCCLHKEM
jgi:hypothetical protein